MFGKLNIPVGGMFKHFGSKGRAVFDEYIGLPGLRAVARFRRRARQPTGEDFT